MTTCNLKHINTFLFDLDATLYPKETGVLDILWQMIFDTLEKDTGFTKEQAKDFFKSVDSSKGLLVFTDHGLEKEKLSTMFNDLDLNLLQPCGLTDKGLTELKGRKVIFTNAPKSHTESVLKHIQLDHHFDYISHTESRNFLIKPHPPIYDDLLSTLSVNPKDCCMIEDSAENLKPAHDLGMTTILISDMANADLPYVDYAYPSLLDWFAAVKQ